MNYRSITDLNDTLCRHRGKLPPDVDLVVGVPRSGLLVANLLSLSLNVPMTDIDGLIAGRILMSGRSRRRACFNTTVETAKSILIVDDSIAMGLAMRDTLPKLSKLKTSAKITTCAIYGTSSSHPDVDIVLEAVPQPRLFQWNVMHHDMLKHCCVDIDGVLCPDPTERQNDDGELYIDFLQNAPPINRPSQRIGRLVTSRLEKYRPQTEEWMERQGITYDELVMLDLPSKEERQRAGVHGTFKAEVYKNCDALLFIESELGQAESIARLSGKPALCMETQHVVRPPSGSATLVQGVRTLPLRMRLKKSPATNLQALAVKVRGVIGPTAYGRLRDLVRR